MAPLEALHTWDSLRYGSLPDRGTSGYQEAHTAMSAPGWWADIKWFQRDEFRCRCSSCDGYPVEPSETLVRLLDQLRESVGIVLIVTSGVRCPKWNEEVGGKPDSAHISGKAADLHCDNSKVRWMIMEKAIFLFDRIGIGETFIHCDTDTTKPAPSLWTYYA